MSSDTNATPSLVPAERLDAVDSLIAPGTSFEGHFRSDRDQGIRVDGHLKGHIVFEHGGTIHVGTSGQIEEAVLEADYIYVEGQVTGTVVARKALEVASSAILVGHTGYDACIAIHPGARVHGTLEFRGDLGA
jgi:cytoskeletal protein CcmA (bactofilin family)